MEDNNGGDLIRTNEEKIHVSVRLRPFNAKEVTSNDVSDWECVDHKTIAYKNSSSTNPASYTFDRVFGISCSTREVYEQGAKDVAVSVVSGVNSTVFAYGQTSSGKTYTMTGITEYAIADVYDYIDKHRERDFALKFSAMEIYNESVRDLLSKDTTPLRLLDDPERGTIVEKLTEEILKDRNHAIQLLSVCEAQRQIGETSLNEMSSRSHQIIRLTIESSLREFSSRDSTGTLSSAVNFVDLAGSERASQSLSAGTRLKEGCHINRSLLTLGTVIRKLSKGGNGHIPFRDSKLTRILQTSLNGNARTAIICTMSPARTHVEQSRNTLLFASCAKEVTTNARVNVVMSDKLMVKHLRKELERVESELRSFHSAFVPSNYFAALREKDSEIEKLEKEVKDLILQRDIARAQVQDLMKMLGDDASSFMMQACTGEYPHLRVQRSPDITTPERESSIFADDNELADVDDDSRTCSDYINCRTISEDQLPKVPHFEEILPSSSSNSSVFHPYQRWDDDDDVDDDGDGKMRNETSEDDLCKEVHCIEAEEFNNRETIESNYLHMEENDTYPAFKVSADGGELRDIESTLSPLSEDRTFYMLSYGRNDDEIDDGVNETTPSNEGQERAYESVLEDEEESTSPVSEKKELRPNVHHVDIENLDNGSFGNSSFKLTRSKSLDACVTNLDSFSWSKITRCNGNTPFITSERELNSPVRRSSREDCESPSENEVDIEIDPANKLSTSELHTEQENTKDTVKDDDRSPVQSPKKKNVKDVGLDPILVEDEEPRIITSWPVEFNRLQKEIIQLWHTCNVSLVHRTYFFLLFQGDPTDAIYLQVEIRRMRFLKDKFDKGEKTVVNGQSLTISSSAKALRRERRTLSEQMLKKFTEEERERLFTKWGININSKWRRMQLAQRLWTNTEDVSDHVMESAILVAKLVGFLEPDKTPDKEMFGLNFTPKCSTKICSFKRSLASLM